MQWLSLLGLGSLGTPSQSLKALGRADAPTASSSKLLEVIVPDPVLKEMPCEGRGPRGGLWDRPEQKLQSSGLFRDTEKRLGKLLDPSSVSFLQICNKWFGLSRGSPLRGLEPGQNLCSQSAKLAHSLEMTLVRKGSLTVLYFTF